MAQLVMWRPAELTVPYVAAPEGYTVREMREGEGADWCRCCEGEFGVAGESEEIFNRYMNDGFVRREDIFFVCRDDRPVGTATVLAKNGRAYLHYIAVHPEHRGRGLCKPLISAVLTRHAEYGLHGCYLSTDDFRLAAIYSYLTFGYLPVMATDDARERFEKILSKLGLDSWQCLGAELDAQPDIFARE